MSLDNAQDLPHLVRLGLISAALLKIDQRQVGARRVSIDMMRTALAIEHESKTNQKPTQIAKPDIRWTSLRGLNQRFPPAHDLDDTVYGTIKLSQLMHEPQYPANPMSVVACASGSVHTLTNAGLPLLNARSIAPRIPSGFSTNSPYPPSASTILS